MDSVSVDKQAPQASAEGQPLERRKSIDGTVKKLIDERQEVLVKFFALAGVGAGDDDIDAEVDFAPSARDVADFCEVLMDYLGTGHFEIYQRIVDGHERRHRVLDAAQANYPTIAETTQFLVEFNDRHESFDGSAEACTALRADLNSVGKAISVRSDFEDRMLEALRK